MTLLRSILYVVWLYGAMTFAGFVYLPAMLLKRDRAELGAGRLWTRLALWGLRWIVGAKVIFKGLEKIPPGACLVASKHQAMLETLAPFLMFPEPAFVLKKELLSAPVLGWYAQRMRMIPIDREANAKALKDLMRAARVSRDEGRQIIIFPEGTRQAPGVKGEYKPGVAALYRDLGIPCVPMALDTGRVWSARGLMRRPGTCTIEVLDPIAPGLSRDEFMRTLEERVEAASTALLAAPPMSIHRKRLGLYIPWALFALVCIGWTIYWFSVRDAAFKALDAARNNPELSIGYSAVRTSGYPLRLTLTLRDAYLLAQKQGLVVRAASAPLSVNLSNPRHLIVGLADGVSWARARDAHRLTAGAGQASVRFSNAGKLERLSLDLKSARIAHTTVTSLRDGRTMSNPAGESAVGQMLLHLRPDPRNRADAQLVLDVADWSGPTPFAALNDLAPFPHFRAAVVVTDYATLAGAQPLQSWTGALRIERFDVAYAGTQVTGDGALDLDAQYRPTGTLRLTPAGGQAVALVAAEGWWSFAGLRVAPAKPLKP